MTLRGREGFVYVARRYRIPERRLFELAIYQYEDGRLTRRIDARVAEWRGGAWSLHQGTERTFTADGAETSRSFDRMRFASAEGPEDFGSPPEDPERLGWFDLRHYVERARARGAPLDRYLVDLNAKLAFPLANLIVGIIGCALAIQLRQPSPALGFGLSVSIAFFYFGVIRLFETLGDGGVLPPVIAGWAAPILFGAWAGALLVQLHRR